MIRFFLTILLLATSCEERPSKHSSDSWEGESASIIQDIELVKAKNYAISTANPHATKAGFDVLAKGGNAIDAAIAAQMVLNVVEPQSSGIGGGGFLLYYDKSSGTAKYFNGRETAPALVHDKIFLNEDGSAKSFKDAVKGGLSVGVPGLLKALKEAHSSYGNIEWKDLFTPAILLAKNGFDIDHRLHVNIKDIDYLSEFRQAKEMYFDSYISPLKVGTIIKNPQLAKTFETIANEGIEPFYNGQIAKGIVNTVRTSKVNPGYLSMIDLAQYKITIGDLVCTLYRNKYKICSMPPPSSGGITLLQILGILENFSFENLNNNSPEFIHLVSEAARLAYEDRDYYISDSESVPVTQMLDKSYLKERSKLIELNKATESFSRGEFSAEISDYFNNYPLYFKHENPSTTHLSVLDSYGNAVALTSSIEYFFGSGLMSDGFFLNNQLTDFSFSPEIDGKKVANRVIPGKRPRSSMSPTFVFDVDDNLLLVLGSPGGPRIIQFVTKTIINHLDFGYDIQESIELPNFVTLNNLIELEKGTELEGIKESLESMGHKVRVKDLVSGVHAISIDRDGIAAGVDPRRAGAALGN